MENHNSRQEHLKGKWIRITQGATPEKYICPFCNRTIESYGLEELLSIRYPYCHCGADMRGEMEYNSTMETKKSESENPVEVVIHSSSINVTFNNVDKDRIQKFIGALDRSPCVYTQEENEFEIRTNVDTLYKILIILTIEFDEIALY